MTSQISKDIKTHIILTYAGSKYYINPKQEFALRSMDDNQRVYIDDRMVRINTIKEILPIDEYYKYNPSERPQYTNYSIDANKIPERRPFKRDRYINALKSMRSGFEEHWYGREMNKAGKNIHELMNRKIKIAENSTQKNWNNPVREFTNSL